MTITRLRAAVCTVAALLAATGATAAEQTESFANADALAAWQTEGPVSVDTSRSHGEGGGSLQIAPGGKAVWNLQDANGSGTVDFWVYEDGSAPADPKARITGPYYGVVQSDGRVLAPGSLYAPYLSGNTTYAVTAFNPAENEKPYFAVQYLGLKRTVGWHQWTMVFSPDAGVTILHNGTDVNDRRERFRWYKTKVEGFTSLVFAGDSTPDANQTVWIDDVTVSLGGPMQVKPEELAPPPPPPMTPDNDPAPAEPVRIIEPLRNVHPRLLFTAEDIPAMREKIKTGYGKSLYDRMLAYVPVSRKPDHTNFLTDGTDGQRQGFWRLPTVALHYVLTGEKQSFDRTVEFMKFLMELENWETGELDSGMSSANIMVGAALAYDWLYNDLDPGFRAQYRDKLLLMARRQYHQGHLMKLPGTHYWQGDPANNHRFHRNAGMALAILAVAEEGKTDDDWLLARTLEELKFIVEWLPEDGTCHESPTYSVFGNTHLMLAMDAGQRCYGEPLMDHPFFKTAPLYKLQTMRPDLKGVFGYGDSGGGTTGYHSYLHRMCAYHSLADELAGITEIERRNETFYNFTWWSVIWWQPLEGGSIDSLPRYVFYPDLGLSYCRTGWQASDVGAMFKCGPFGGYKLNEYRHRNDMKYVNVAHDDPDANSFTIFADGEMLAETDRYSKHKQSANHNTILVNGAGQVVSGRPEGGGWSQPGGDMSVMAVVTGYARNGSNVAVEGEAAGSYLANPRQGPERPALDRYRRTFLWVEGRYILVLDDIRAPEPVDIAWLMQGPELESAAEADAHRYVLKKDAASCPFQVAATEPLSTETIVSPADSRGEPLGWRQLRLKATTDAIRLASVYDPWHQGELTVTLNADTPEHATVTVFGPDIRDSWDWTAAQDRFGPSRIVGRHARGDEIMTMSQPEPQTRKLLDDIRRLGQAVRMGRLRVAASAWEQKAKGGWADFPPENTVDGQPTKESSWRAEGDGQWIQYDMRTPQQVVAVELAFVDGATRRYSFSIETSSDAETWRPVHKGTSSGETEDFERFEIDAPDARYLRIVGHGNTNEKFKDWINLTEVRIHAATD